MLTIHHFGAETQGSEGLVDQIDLRKVRVPEKSQFLRGFRRYIRLHPKATSPVLKIWFGPPNADFWSVWSSQKAREFQQIQPTTKMRILCFEWKRICFQTRDVLCSYNMNYEE